MALWNYLFDIPEKGERYTFHRYILTDGVAVSFCMERLEKARQPLADVPAMRKREAKQAFLQV